MRYLKAAIAVVPAALLCAAPALADTDSIARHRRQESRLHRGHHRRLRQRRRPTPPPSTDSAPYTDQPRSSGRV
jgi:hypothetical protein